ncbi:MAG: aromatic amino acid hydroxylase [candidate division Zixibacteria bacterium]|nr:aromatic amino acid hydroxylase [candidate division Zixibacteria bacterium]
MATQVEEVTKSSPLDANAVLANLPLYLKQFVVDQNYKSYTPQDHAIWRYVMRQNIDFLKNHAHRAYLEGLSQTGIDLGKIPSIENMNRILGKIGWAAVNVDGFIPPAAFLAFQGFRVLVVAADIRQINHIEYTPAPDIIHEAAGHAPIIAEPEYAEYLRSIGAAGAKAMSSRKDFELYEAIRRLSILKETPDADPKVVEESEKEVHYKQDNLGEPSEMALLSRLHWWTVEYGLIGDLDNFKIYGAGLLSSIGESYRCLSSEIKKIPYNLDTANYVFDITAEQPHLFVTPSFQHLTEVLEDFSKDMAYRKADVESINKAIECKNPSTCQYSSGVQLSGVFTEVMTDNANQPVYLKTSGPSSLAFADVELPGHDKNYHKDGFGSPVGKLKNSSKPLEDMTDGDLAELGIATGKTVTLHFESGVVVKGRLDNCERREGKLILMVFGDCSVNKNGAVLFEPSWGTYDMTVGEKIVSVFHGAADKDAYEQPSIVSRSRTVKVKKGDKERKLFELYQTIRDCRDNDADYSRLPQVWETLRDEYSDKWLSQLELLELLLQHELYPEIQKEIREFLENLAKSDKEITKLINDGLRIISTTYSASEFAAK